MKTTIELPDDLLERTKVAAAQRRTSLKKLVIEGLEIVLGDAPPAPDVSAALDRLEKGIHLSGKMLTREEAHAR